MLKDVILIAFVTVIVGSIFNSKTPLSRSSEYSHFKCLRKNRTFNNGLENAANKCEKIIKSLEVRE